MKRILALITAAVIASAAVYLFGNHDDDISLVNARAVPIEGRDNMFMVTLEVQNNGPAKSLTAVTSPSVRGAHVMNPNHSDASIVIPAESTGFFAMDGAHIMLMGADEGFVEGSFLPLTLTFSDYGDVNARVLYGSDMGAMDHSVESGIRAINAPTISLSAPDGFTARGAEISVAVENFSFVRAPEGTVHTPLEGHAHIYLNGLKIGRLYTPHFTLGALPSGAYDLTVSLNSNDHQPYIRAGEVVQDTLSFEIE